MPNIGGKVSPLHTTRSESSTKGYMKHTTESRNKRRNRNMDEEDQVKKRSPLKSPRLCEEEENYSPNNLHLKMEIKREYYHQKYDDPAQAQPIENKTYFQTLPQDEFGDSYEHKPKPPSGSSSSKKLRKQRWVTPKSSDKNEEYREKAEFGKEHKLCNMKLSVKEREINRLKGIIDNLSKPLEAKVFTYEIEKSKRFDDLQRQVKKLKDQLFEAKSNLEKEQEKTERLTHQNQEKEDKLADMRLKYMRMQKGINEFKQMHEGSPEREKKIVEQQTALEKMCTKMGTFKKVNDSLSEKNDKLEDWIRKLQTKLDHLERVGKTHQLCVEIQDWQSRYIKELECEVESQYNNFVSLRDEYEKLNCSSSYSTMKVEVAKVKHLQSELDAKTEEVNKLTRQQIRAESLSLEVKILQREKANVEEQNSELTRALQAKGIEMESLIKHRERSEKQIRNLNNEISDIQKSKRHTVNESLQQLLTENSALKSTLEHRKLEIENLSKECEKQRRTRDKGEHEMTELEQVVQKKNNEVEELNTRLEEFSKKCSALHRDKEEAHAKISALTDALYEKKRDVESLTNQLERYKDLSKELINVKQDKENAEYEISSLSNALYHKDKELESVQNKLARAENKVSILSQDIKDIQESKRLADEKLQGLQTENSSLKSALSKATKEIDDFLKKGTSLQKYKTDAEHKTRTLMNALQEKETEKETEIEALREQLARAEKNVSILSQDIKDIQASKRQDAEEKLQGLQTENFSLKSALSKANNEIEALLKKGTNLQKHKTDAEHKTRTLNNALKEKETEIEDLREQLARAEKNVSILSQDIKDIQASKCQVAEEKLQGLQTENSSLKSALSKATNEIKDLSNKGTNLQKYKTEAEHKTSTLMNALKEKETENEALREQLARSEENVSILSKDIKNIQESKRQVADEKLQDIQTENASLKLTLAEATTEIDDLWKKCTNLQNYKSDTDHEIRTLLNAIEEKDTEIENLRKHLARSEENVSILSKDKDIQGSKRKAADEKVQSLKTENASLKLQLAEATTEKSNELSKEVSDLKKDKENAEKQKNRLSKALDEKEKEIEIMRNDIARYKEKISTLTNIVEDIKESNHQAADENTKGLQKKIGYLESDLRSATTKMNDLSYKYRYLQKEKESAEYTIKKLSKTVEEKEMEIDSLIEKLAKANENLDREEHIASANSIQKLKDENASLKLELSQLSHVTEKKVSALTEEIKSLQKSKGTSSEVYNARKLHDENEFLKAQLDRTSRSYEQLRKDYNEVKREKDHALNRLSSVAGEKLRNNNPGIADLSDENRPINLGEKFSQLYDDQWTDAIEHLEEMGYTETGGIRCLLDILKAVFDECVKLSDIHFNQLKELTGTSHLPSDQLKKLKDLRKATAIHSVAKTKQLVNDYMSTAFSKEKAACQTYIDRSIELCWLMSVQDPPVVIDFIAIHGQAIDDKILRKFTKTGSKIDFLVWPVIRLHKNGPLLQKGVVQPI